MNAKLPCMVHTPASFDKDGIIPGSYVKIGEASSIEHARKVFARHVKTCPNSASLIAKYGFILQVFRRCIVSRELNGGPDCFLHSIGK